MLVTHGGNASARGEPVVASGGLPSRPWQPERACSVQFIAMSFFLMPPQLPGVLMRFLGYLTR